MRTNQPVTQHEYEYPASQMLVSATDLTGRIQYCNPAFLAVSGYAKEELIGEPHNIIRHPDMPREAFGDMWDTIRAGHPWTGLVKNRRKNGDHYWVRANVTPVTEQGNVVGYLSVRVKPSHEEIRNADALYRKMREGRLLGQRLRHGAVIRTGLPGVLQLVLRIPVSTRIALGYAAVPAVLAATGFAAWQGIPPLPFWTVFGSASVCCVAAWWLVKRHLRTALHQMSAISTRMAAGDLTANLTITAHDDLGDVLQAMNQLQANLKAIVLDIHTQVEEMVDVTQELSSGNTDLARRTEMQAASLEETAATMDQLTTTIQANANASAHALDLARDAKSAATEGSSIAGQVERTIASITEASRRIADITGVIDGIAFQTNIIAVNAAVEAAHAGATGRSFAVVAGEVRMLAQRCAASAKEIKQVVDASVSEVTEGTQLVARATAQMRTINEAIARVSSIIVEVANVSAEQSESISQLNHAVSHLGSTTQQNAALVEQTAGTAKRLTAQADVLGEAIRLFCVTGAQVADERHRAANEHAA